MGSVGWAMCISTLILALVRGRLDVNVVAFSIFAHLHYGRDVGDHRFWRWDVIGRPSTDVFLQGAASVYNSTTILCVGSDGKDAVMLLRICQFKGNVTSHITQLGNCRLATFFVTQESSEAQCKADIASCSGRSTARVNRG